MSTSTYRALAIEPQVNVPAMADIVKDLVAGDRFRQRDSDWLRERAATAGLNEHEYAALESLRVRLYEQGATLLAVVRKAAWN